MTRSSHRCGSLVLALAVLLAVTGCTTPTTTAASTRPPKLSVARDVARYRHDIEKFQKRDAEHPPPAHALLFIGSSSIRAWKLDEGFPHTPTINRGFGGAQLADVVTYAPKITWAYDPKCIVIYCGDNDIAAGLTPQQVRDNFEVLLNDLRQHMPEVPIVYLSIKHSIRRDKLWPKMDEANRMIKAVCEAQPNLTYLDVADALLGSDGKPDKKYFRHDDLHMTKAGYAKWVALLHPVVDPIMHGGDHLADSSAKPKD